MTDWNWQLWVSFCPLTSPTYSPPSPKNPKNQNFEKMKKIAEDIIILHNCTNRGTVPEIWSETDRIFCHFGPFFAFITPNNWENQNFKTMKKHLEMPSLYTGVPKITIIWCMLLEIWNTTDTIFCHFGPFLSFYPTNDPKNKNLE